MDVVTIAQYSFYELRKRRLEKKNMLHHSEETSESDSLVAKPLFSFLFLGLLVCFVVSFLSQSSLEQRVSTGRRLLQAVPLIKSQTHILG
jgi:hypothetical protein